jgi:hypothetical protein
LPGTDKFAKTRRGVLAKFSEVQKSLTNSRAKMGKTLLPRPLFFGDSHLCLRQFVKERPFGPVAVAWQKTSRGFRLEINVPAGTSGTVGVPTSSNSDPVTDNGRPVKKDAKMTAAIVSGTALALVLAIHISLTWSLVRM